MNISQTLADAFAAHRGLDALTTQLRTAGHLSASQGLQVTGTTLMTSDAAGNPLELSSPAQTLVTAYVPPAPPSSPSYGADLLSDDDLMAQAATIVTGLRTYIALASPTNAQNAQALQAIAKLGIYLIRYRFPSL